MSELIAMGTAKALDYVNGKLMDKLVQRFQTDVIQKWTKKRAENFFQIFCEEVAKELPDYKNNNVEVLLDGDVRLNRTILQKHTTSSFRLQEFHSTHQARIVLNL